MVNSVQALFSLNTPVRRDETVFKPERKRTAQGGVWNYARLTRITWSWVELHKVPTELLNPWLQQTYVVMSQKQINIYSSPAYVVQLWDFTDFSSLGSFQSARCIQYIHNRENWLIMSIPTFFRGHSFKGSPWQKLSDYEKWYSLSHVLAVMGEWGGYSISLPIWETAHYLGRVQCIFSLSWSWLLLNCGMNNGLFFETVAIGSLV
jgi:hypothetical protein